MSSSSDRIAAEFMAQGRPAPEPVQSSGSRPGDMSAGLEIKTPQFGTGFAEWAVKGYDLDGCVVKEQPGADYCPPDVTANLGDMSKK